MIKIDTDMNYETAKEKFLTGKINESKTFFIKHKFKLEHAYCLILEDKLNEAEKTLLKIEKQDQRAHWLLVMIGFIKGIAEKYPTYFELRNFLETDLNILIQYYKGDYVEKIIRYADYMFTINPEVYKYIGRVFLNNDLKQQGLFFLNIAKNRFYQDPELHYLLAQTYYTNKDYENCKHAIQACLSILPGYAPAIMLSKKI